MSKLLSHEAQHVYHAAYNNNNNVCNQCSKESYVLNRVCSVFNWLMEEKQEEGV